MTEPDAYYDNSLKVSTYSDRLYSGGLEEAGRIDGVEELVSALGNGTEDRRDPEPLQMEAVTHQF